MIAIMFVTLLVMLIIGVPVSFSIGISALTYLFAAGFPPPLIMVQKMIDGVNSFPLLALPLFILSGEIMAYGCTPRLMRLANLILGRVPGGLGAAGIAGCGFFGAISGSGVATTAAIGGVVAPEMVRKGYGKGYSAAVMAGAGTLGMVIPPSLPMVIFATSSSNISIGRMFMAGLIPGLMVVGLLIVLNTILSIRRNYGAERALYAKGEPLRIVIDALFPLLTPVIILGGVLSGVVTPTEAGVLAVVYAFLLSVFMYGEFKYKHLVQVATKTVVTSSIILFIMSSASPFGWLMATQNIPTRVAATLLSLDISPLFIHFAIMLLLLFLGTFMETNSIIILLTPMLLPVVMGLGQDPIHFGTIMMLNLAIGGATPPLAVCLFTSTRIVGIKVEETFPDILYVVGFMVIGLILTLLFPGLALWMPTHLMPV